MIIFELLLFRAPSTPPVAVFPSGTTQIAVSVGDVIRVGQAGFVVRQIEHRVMPSDRNGNVLVQTAAGCDVPKNFAAGTPLDAPWRPADDHPVPWPWQPSDNTVPWPT